MKKNSQNHKISYIRSYLFPLAKDSCQGDSGGPLMNLIQENGVNKYEWIGVVRYNTF